MPSPDLLLGNVMASESDSVPHSRDRQVLRDDDNVERHDVADAQCLMYQLDLGLMREHRLCGE